MKTFTRFCQMKTLSQVVVLNTAALLVVGFVLATVGSPMVLPVLIAACLPFPAGLVIERIAE